MIKTINQSKKLNLAIKNAEFIFCSKNPQYTGIYYIIDDTGFMLVGYYQTVKSTGESFWRMQNGSEVPESFFWLKFDNPILPF